jgi:hypothetical protein
MDADFSNWWNGGYVNGGDESAVPMLIARPIVEHELRASRTNNRLNNGHYRSGFNLKLCTVDIVNI